MSNAQRPADGPETRPLDDLRVTRAVRAWLEDGVATLPDGMELPGGVRRHLIDQLTTTPQRRRWWSDRWPTRGRRVLRSDGVPGSTDDRRTRRMFGFALLAAAALGGAAVLAGVTQDQQAGPRTIVVAQDGSGDATSIGDGVALADDRDTVLIRPGTYHEQVTVTDAITLRGDGPREAVVWEGLGGPPGEDPFALFLDHAAATVTDLTLNGMPSTLRISGGSPLVEGIAIIGTGVPYGSSASCTDERGCGVTLTVEDGSTAIIRGNHFEGGADVVVDGDADPVFEGNTLTGGPQFYLANPGDAAVVRDNTISGTLDRAIGVFAPTTMLIEGNTITETGGDGITVGWNASPGVDPVIRGNTIRALDSATTTAINIQPASLPTIEGNTITGGQFGIYISGADAIVRDNTLTGIRAVAIAASSGGAPRIEGNTIENATTAFSIDSGIQTVLSGNELCGNTVDYRHGGKEAALPPGNPVCAASGSPSAAP